jgi:hypothetical protein
MCQSTSGSVRSRLINGALFGAGFAAGSIVVNIALQAVVGAIFRVLVGR